MQKMRLIDGKIPDYYSMPHSAVSMAIKALFDGGALPTQQEWNKFVALWASEELSTKNLGIGLYKYMIEVCKNRK